jgi:hypothetical protein
MLPKPGSEPILKTVRSILAKTGPTGHHPVPPECLKGLPTVEIIGRICDPFLAVAQECVSLSHQLGHSSEPVIQDGDESMFDTGSSFVKMTESVYDGQLSRIINGLFWSGVYHHVPELTTVGGKFVLYRGWHVAVIPGQKFPLPEVVFGPAEFGHQFFRMFCDILDEKVLFQGGPVGEVDTQDLTVVGTLNDVAAQQLVLLKVLLQQQIATIDPWPTSHDEFGAFVGKPFNEYALFYERRHRLRVYDALLNALIPRLFFDSMDGTFVDVDPDDGFCLYLMNDWSICTESS